MATWTRALPQRKTAGTKHCRIPFVSAVKKQIRLNGIDMMCMGCTPGIWRHPKDQSEGYTSLRYWTDLARLLERGKFDCLFLADIFGIYDVYRGGPEPAFKHAVEFPVCDPMMTVPAMAVVTEHLGFRRYRNAFL